MPHSGITVKCPFYKRENQVTIFCESNIRVREEGKTGYYAHLFRSAKAKEAYMREHCKRYPDMNCPYANFMEAFYRKLRRNFGTGKRGDRNKEDEKNEIEDETEKSEAGNHTAECTNKRIGAGKQVFVRLM